LCISYRDFKEIIFVMEDTETRKGFGMRADALGVVVIKGE
jgi:hypothetical protein